MNLETLMEFGNQDYIEARKLYLSLKEEGSKHTATKLEVNSYESVYSYRGIKITGIKTLRKKTSGQTMIWSFTVPTDSLFKNFMMAVTEKGLTVGFNEWCFGETTQVDLGSLKACKIYIDLMLNSK